MCDANRDEFSSENFISCFQALAIACCLQFAIKRCEVRTLRGTHVLCPSRVLFPNILSYCDIRRLKDFEWVLFRLVFRSRKASVLIYKHDSSITITLFGSNILDYSKEFNGIVTADFVK